MINSKVIFRYLWISLPVIGLPIQSQAATPGMSDKFVAQTIFARDIGLDIYANTSSNPMSCSITGAFRITPSVANYNALVSTMITAYSMQKSVSFWVFGGDTDGASLVSGMRVN